MLPANTYPNPIQTAQAQKEVTANEALAGVIPAALFSKKLATTGGLTWGYFGGYMWVAGVWTLIADGTVALTDAATNYIESTMAGVVSRNTVGFTVGRIPLYKAVCAGGVVTSYIDARILKWAPAALALPSVITPSGSPYLYQNTFDGDVDVIVKGGTVTLIEYTRDNSTFYDVGVIAGMFSLSTRDRLRVTYSVAPTMTLITR